MSPLDPIRGLGAAGLTAAAVGRHGASIFLRTIRASLRGRREPGEVAAQMYQIGNRSFVFVGVTLGFIGMILVFQICMQIQAVIGDLSQVGAEFIRALVHQFGPTLTGMMLATRVGAGIAAEIASMVVTEQVDALRMCGVDPVSYLIVPRFLASLVMTFVLVVVGICFALLAGMLSAQISFSVNPAIFLDPRLVQSGDIAVGAMKSLAYGAAIPVIAGLCGLRARGGSEGVGRATTQAVIACLFTVIVLDFLIGAFGLAVLQRPAGG